MHELMPEVVLFHNQSCSLEHKWLNHALNKNYMIEYETQGRGEPRQKTINAFCACMRFSDCRNT